jgi:hypothetical protein
VKDEFELYKCIVAYIESTAEDLQESQIEELMKSIRFCFMTFAQLEGEKMLLPTPPCAVNVDIRIHRVRKE